MGDTSAMVFRALASWFLLAGVGVAQIVWISDECRVEAEPGVASMEGVFEFRNEGPVPVRVEKLKAACGCTAVVSERGVVQPGEIGAIRVTFKPGDRRGWYETAISATVGGETKKLRFVAGLIPAREVVPKVLMWRKGENGGTKAVTVTRQRGSAQVSVAVERVADGFTAAVEEDLASGVWVIRFDPARAGGGRGSADIAVVLEDGKRERFTIALRDQR